MLVLVQAPSGSPPTGGLPPMQGVSSSLQALRPQGPTITPSLANHYRDDLVNHVRNWPADILEKQVSVRQLVVGWLVNFALNMAISGPETGRRSAHYGQYTVFQSVGRAEVRQVNRAIDWDPSHVARTKVSGEVDFSIYFYNILMIKKTISKRIGMRFHSHFQTKFAILLIFIYKSETHFQLAKRERRKYEL